MKKTNDFLTWDIQKTNSKQALYDKLRTAKIFWMFLNNILLFLISIGVAYIVFESELSYNKNLNWTENIISHTKSNQQIEQEKIIALKNGNYYIDKTDKSLIIWDKYTPLYTVMDSWALDILFTSKNIDYEFKKHYKNKVIDVLTYKNQNNDRNLSEKNQELKNLGLEASDYIFWEKILAIFIIFSWILLLLLIFKGREITIQNKIDMNHKK